MTKVWLSRGGDEGQYEELALSNGTTGGGFEGISDLTNAGHEDVKQVVAKSRPDKGIHTTASWAGQLWTLRQRMGIGDYLLMPHKRRKTLAIGLIKSGYMFNGDRPDGERHFRQVEWVKDDVPKTAFSDEVQNSLKIPMTICEIHRENVVQLVAAVIERTDHRR